MVGNINLESVLHLVKCLVYVNAKEVNHFSIGCKNKNKEEKKLHET